MSSLSCVVYTHMDIQCHWVHLAICNCSPHLYLLKLRLSGFHTFCFCLILLGTELRAVLLWTGYICCAKCQRLSWWWTLVEKHCHVVVSVYIEFAACFVSSFDQGQVWVVVSVVWLYYMICTLYNICHWHGILAICLASASWHAVLWQVAALIVCVPQPPYCELVMSPLDQRGKMAYIDK